LTIVAKPWCQLAFWYPFVITQWFMWLSNYKCIQRRQQLFLGLVEKDTMCCNDTYTYPKYKTWFENRMNLCELVP